ncbi:MAG: hypothetical protein ACK4J0_02045 [Candidatus Anstonellaceae archaeon]
MQIQKEIQEKQEKLSIAALINKFKEYAKEFKKLLNELSKPSYTYTYDFKNKKFPLPENTIETQINSKIEQIYNLAKTHGITIASISIKEKEITIKGKIEPGFVAKVAFYFLSHSDEKKELEQFLRNLGYVLDSSYNPLSGKFEAFLKRDKLDLVPKKREE